jgi:CubicO group peptidase (beta-lactamase class C family)
METIAAHRRDRRVDELQRGRAHRLARHHRGRRAYGLAHRGHGVANTSQTRFALASGAKGFTALAVMSLVEEGVLSLSTTARSLLGADLPLIDDGVTVEQLLAHTSGIGDYLDEEAGGDVLDYAMSIPVHLLSEPEGYLPALDGFPSKAAPGEQWAYNNSAYAVLAVLAERASGTSYYDLVHTRVCTPAGLRNTEFLRSDQLDGSAAIGYLQPSGLQTNVLHLPVRGTGDGGIYSTLADMHLLWSAFADGRIVALSTIAEMVRLRPTPTDQDDDYGLGSGYMPGRRAQAGRLRPWCVVPVVAPAQHRTGGHGHLQHHRRRLADRSRARRADHHRLTAVVRDRLPRTPSSSCLPARGARLRPTGRWRPLLRCRARSAPTSGGTLVPPRGRRARRPASDRRRDDGTRRRHRARRATSRRPCPGAGTRCR